MSPAKRIDFAQGAVSDGAIFLINQISGHGHLDMYARLYSKSLLERGYDVVLISQHDPGMREWIAAHVPHAANRFTFFTRDDLEDRSFVRAPRPPAPGAPAWWRLPSLAQRAYNRIPERWRARIEAHSMRGVRLARRAKHALLRGLPRRSRKALRVLRGDGPADALKDMLKPMRHHPLPFGVPFGNLGDDIKEVTHRTGIKPAFALFLYLDMMSQEAQSCYDLEALGVPFAGIRFHPNGSFAGTSFRAERYLLCPNARGAIFLNPQSIPHYQRRFPHLHFKAFPDITDAATLPAPSELVKTMKDRARGRRIVLQLGTLSPHKGIFDLIALIRRADPKQFFFAIIGEVFWSAYGEREEELRAFLENPPENCLVQLGYLNDERELNSVIQASDILYAVYREGFYNSSNTMTKAAVFEKPILVSDKYLMGERVRAYQIGETVQSGDIEDTLFWLEEVAARPRNRFGFARFRRDHSIEALDAALGAAMAQWLGQKRRTSAAAAPRTSGGLGLARLRLQMPNL